MSIKPPIYELDHPEIRESVSRLCEDFPGEYWRKCDREQAYPGEFVKALTESGFLGALIPESYGGSGLPLSAGAAILERFTARAVTPGRAMPRCTPWAPCCDTALKPRRKNTCRLSPGGNCGFRHLGLPSRPAEPIRPRFGLQQTGSMIITW